jgi:hypothetical protein
MNNKTALESLSMDLKRVALGYHRGSTKMAEKFTEEAMKRKKEVDHSLLKPYMQRILNQMESKLNSEDKTIVSESSLLMSTLVQNYTQTFLK